ncbi:MAG: hypothetical protein ABIT10_12500 [Alteraurantiacibacter sp.]
MHRTLAQTLVVLPLLMALAGCGSEDEAAAPVGPSPSSSATAAPATGADFDATASIVCIINGEVVEHGCMAGIKRGWTDDGGGRVAITKPDGTQRAIFTDAIGNPTLADSSQADRSSGWTMVITRVGTTSVIDFGPEHYELPDAFVLGG